MPNITNSHLKITGPSQALDAIEAMCPGGKLDFQQVVPLPRAVYENGAELCAARCLGEYYLGQSEASKQADPAAGLAAYAAEQGLEAVPSLEELEAQFPELPRLGLKAGLITRSAPVSPDLSTAPSFLPIIWACAEWGTKWPAMEGRLQRVSPEELRLSCVTAWAPPHGVMVTLCEKYGVDLLMAFVNEGGLCGAGVRHYLPDGPGEIWTNLNAEAWLGEETVSAEQEPHMFLLRQMMSADFLGSAPEAS